MNEAAGISPRERAILRDLAREVSDIACLPVMAERKELWIRHNELWNVRPLVLVSAEGSWRELLPDSALACQGEKGREVEQDLRQRILSHAFFHDDLVIEGHYTVHKMVRVGDWGLVARRIPSTSATGAWAFDPVIASPRDLEKLRLPEVSYDEKATARELSQIQDLFGDILEVRLKGVSYIGFHLTGIYSDLRGLENVMLDMYDNPSMLQDAMEILTRGYEGMVRQFVEQNLLSLNNDNTNLSSGGIGCTHELPRPDYDPARIRPCDMWASAESQEMAQVSPALHERFVMAYERRLLEPFGLNGYGCCDDLTRKLDAVCEMPRMRRISIAPWADVEKCAEKLGNRFILSWKPNPAHLVGSFDADRIRAYIAHTLEVTRGCVLEMVLKDTHTCEYHPERFTRWTDIAQNLISEL